MEEANKSATPASFVCEKCKGDPSMDQIVQSIETYGLIWLTNDENTWVGFNCPLCEKPWTIIKKFKHEEIRPFGLEMGKRIAYDSGTLVYHSFPFSMHHLVAGRDFVGRFMQQFELPIDKLEEESFSPFDPYGDINCPRNIYTSYLFGNKAFGPAIAIWLYSDEDIEKLVSHESESGLRAFPRYRLYDSLYSDIDRFCWQERLHIDFIKELNLDWPIAEILSSPAKKDLTKTFDFMHILDMTHLQDIPAYIVSERKPHICELLYLATQGMTVYFAKRESNYIKKTIFRI